MREVSVPVNIVLITGLTMVLSCLAFILPLRKRRCFAGRMFLMIAIGCVLELVLDKLESKAVWLEIFVLGHYLYVVLTIYTCVDTKGFEPWYCGVWCLLTQSFISEAAIFIGGILFQGNKLWLRNIITFVAIFFSYALIYATLARTMPENGHYQVGPRQTVSALLLGLLFEYLFTEMHFFNGSWALNLFAQFYCATILYLQSALFKKSALRQELDMIQLLWHQQQEQYQVSRETIEIINRKCHDLKHQVRLMRKIENDGEKEKYLEEIEKSVQIYSAIVKTGNEILDVILTEKSLFCEKEEIYINCVADGKLLSYMDSIDLYTMFGNAIDNSIEAVRGMEDKEKRQIDIQIFSKKNFLIIWIMNPLSGQLTFEDGLPVTTKAQNGYHGYGLKSIRHTIEKYDGFLDVETKDGWFYLKMMAPLPKETSVKS